MSQRCHVCREHKSQGSIGHARLCFDCCAEMLQRTRHEVRRQRIPIQLTNGPRILGPAVWVPDSVLSIEREAARG